MSPTPLPPSLQRHLASELMPGERVLWAGTPRPWPALLIRLPLALLGLWLAMMAAPWVSFFVAHALGLVEPGRDGGTPRLVSVVASLFLLPFAAGLAGLILSPLLAALSALVTVRAVTDRRVLGLRGGLFPKAESLPATRVTGASQVRVGPFTWLRIEIEGAAASACPVSISDCRQPRRRCRRWTSCASRPRLPLRQGMWLWRPAKPWLARIGRPCRQASRGACMRPSIPANG